MLVYLSYFSYPLFPFFFFFSLIVLKIVPYDHIDMSHRCLVAWFSTTWMSDIFMSTFDEHSIYFQYLLL